MGSFVDSNDIERGFSLDKGRFTAIDPPGSKDTKIFAVNSFDNIVGLDTVQSGSGFSNVLFKGFCSSVF